MIITQITPTNQKKYKVEIDGQFAFVLYKGELSRYHLREGEEIDEATYRLIIDEVLTKRAKMRCNYLLTDMDRTEKQMRDILVRNQYPAEVIDRTMQELIERGYIDDRRYASNYVASRSGKKSRKMLEYDLMKKGVAFDTIADVIGECGEEEQTEALQKALHKKWSKQVRPTYEEGAKIKAYLVRKGFSYDQVSREYSRFAEELPEDD